MKPILFLLGALLAGAASAGLTVLLVAPGNETGRSAVVAPEAVGPAGPSSDVEGLRGEIDLLARTVGDLASQLEQLQASQSRQPMVLEESDAVTAESLSAAGLTPVQIEERMRDVFAAERQREEEQREVEEAERSRAQAERQAERIATELGLPPADQTRLAEHFVAAGAKRRELFEGMRTGSFDRESMRASMEELREWNTAELYRSFSPSVAAQLEELGNDMFGGGRGPGGFGGRRGGGGNDGGAAPPGGG